MNMVLLGRTVAAVVILASIAQAVTAFINDPWNWGAIPFFIAYPMAQGILVLLAVEILAELRRRR